MDAENLFKGYLEVFPNSAKAEEVDYMRAYSFYKQSPKLELEQVNTLKAMNMMQTFINTHPGSSRIKDATDIIDQCRQKMEMKEFRSAQLYYNLEQYKASAIAFANLFVKCCKNFSKISVKAKINIFFFYRIRAKTMTYIIGSRKTNS